MNKMRLPFMVFSKMALVSIATATLVTGNFGFADDLPVLRMGMWEYTRTVPGPDPAKPQTMTTHKCASPSEDWKQQNEMLTKMGCKFTPIKKAGDTYTFMADCNVKTPDGGAVSSSSTTVITIQSSDAFTVKVDTVTNGKKSVENLTAKRTGDCQK